MNNTRVAVLGAGSWGTVLAAVLAENGCQVTLWARRQAVVDEINHKRTNRQYLSAATLPTGMIATSSLSEAVLAKEFVFFVVPSHFMREVAQAASKWMDASTLVVHAAKGLEQGTWKRMSEVLEEELSPEHHGRITVLSGPSHAEEVIQRRPTAVVVAAANPEIARQVQAVLLNSYFRVYTNPDLVGVEVGGTLKNIIALAAGWVDGLSLGDNARAALITRGLAEMARLGLAMGAKPITFAGLAGVGDLVVTCTSRHSRNWKAGYMISQGKKLEQVLHEVGMVVEGIKTTRAAHALSQQYGVEMPLTDQLYAVLFQGKAPAQAVVDLMQRECTGELAEIFPGW
jgi:glycerol-3-phosphate dehydrogenase (NAD(P)+)